MKSKKVPTITSNEEQVRLEIFEGHLPIDEAGAELLRVEKAQHSVERQRRMETQNQLSQLSAKYHAIPKWIRWLYR